MPNRSLKYFLSLICLLSAFAGFSQIPAYRAPASVMVIDQRLHPQLQFGLPVYPDTTTANANLGGLDSLGLVIVIRANPVTEYIRDSSSGTHKWSLWVGSGGGAVTSVFGRVGVVTAQTGDYTAAQVTHAVDQTGSYFNPVWITGIAAATINGTANLTAGSSKVTIGGAAVGVGSLLIPASVDVVPGNILLSTLGGTLSVPTQISATGTPGSTTALFGDGSWKVVTSGQSAIQFHDAVNGNLNTAGLTTTVNFLQAVTGTASGGNTVAVTLTHDSTITSGDFAYGYHGGRYGYFKDSLYFVNGTRVLQSIGNSTVFDSVALGGVLLENTYISGNLNYNLFLDSMILWQLGTWATSVSPILTFVSAQDGIWWAIENQSSNVASTNHHNSSNGIQISNANSRYADAFVYYGGGSIATSQPYYINGYTARFKSGKALFALAKETTTGVGGLSFYNSTLLWSADSVGMTSNVGGTEYPIQSISATTTLDNTMHFIETSGFPTFHFPTASTCPGREYWLVNTTAGGVTTDTYTTIAGGTSTSLATHTSLHIVSDGTVWQQF